MAPSKIKLGGKASRSPLYRRLVHIFAYWGMLMLALLALAVAALVVFAPVLGKIVLQTFGLGVIFLLLGLVAIAWVLWRRRLLNMLHLLQGILRGWNRWLGALILVVFGFGALAFFQPQELVIGGVSLAETTLGGSIGLSIIGAPDAGGVIRLVVLFLAGMTLLIPRYSPRFWWGFLKIGVRVVVATLESTLKLLLGFITWSRSLYRRRPLQPLAKARPKTAAPPPRTKMAKKAPAKEPSKAPLPEAVAEAEEEEVAAGLWALPPFDLLDSTSEVERGEIDPERRARMIEEALASYGVEARVVQVSPGPAVTQFGVEPGWVRKYRKVVERDQNGRVRLDKGGSPKVRLEEVSKTRVKVDRIVSLQNDLALALAVPSIRVEAPVPGKPMVGIEVPNVTTVVVPLRSVAESASFQKLRDKSALALALGRGAAGEVVIADLAKMPHLLVAGATGSGKTVCLNCIITCLLMHSTPDEVRLILIDPKRVEFMAYRGVPHLLSPVVVDIEHAIETLRRVTKEMESRFQKLAAVGARNIEAYNSKPGIGRPLPYLVVIIDELADFMMTAASVVEPIICRLAQLSRATGIHLVIATQRPSVDVITGLIKANFPTRIAFALPSQIDSRTILDTVGAEKLLGWGDMLYLPPDAAKPKRLRGCFLSDQEIERVVDFWKRRPGAHLFPQDDQVAQVFASLEGVKTSDEDSLLEQARQLARGHHRISTSLLQRKLRIGYPRAARLIDLLEEEGLVDSGEPGQTREVLPSDEEEDEETG